MTSSMNTSRCSADDVVAAAECGALLGKPGRHEKCWARLAFPRQLLARSDGATWRPRSWHIQRPMLCMQGAALLVTIALVSLAPVSWMQKPDGVARRTYLG